MNKRAIAILGAIFILIAGTLGFLIYSKYSKKSTTTDSLTAAAPSPTTPEPTNTTPPPSPTPPVSQAFVQLTSDQVISPALFYNGRGISYFDKQGNLFLANFSENTEGPLVFADKQQLGIPAKSGINKILWPARGNDFIAEFKDSAGKKSWSYFNSSLGIYTDLPSQLETIDWMPSGDKIMYVWLANSKSTINIANPDASNWQALGDMWENDDEIQVSPDGTQVLYFETAAAAGDNAINSVTSDGKVWKTLVKLGQNFGVLWSPDSQKFLFGKKDTVSQKYQLWVYNTTSGEVKNLALSTTVDKAVWDKDSNVVYAAVPNSGSAGGAVLTTDSFFRIDISATQNKQYPDSSSAIDGRDLFLNSTGDKLFFRNAQDGALYYLDLSQ